MLKPASLRINTKVKGIEPYQDEMVSYYIYIYIYIYTRKYSYIHNNFIQESLHLGFVQIQILRAVEIVEIPDGEDP